MNLKWILAAAVGLAIIVGCDKPTAAVNDPPPDPSNLMVTGLDGKTIRVGDLKGSVVYIDFWAPWCDPCRKGLPFTQRLYDTFKDKGLVVMAISDDPKNSVERFVKGFKYTFPTYLDSGHAAQVLNASALPHGVIIGRDGKIVAEEEGLAPQSELIERLSQAGLDMSGFEPKDDPVAAMTE